MVTNHRGFNRPQLETQLWVIGIAVFFLGDLVTTWFGLRLGAAEANPIMRGFLHQYGVLETIILFKVAYFAVAYIIYRIAPKEYDIGVPAATVFVGTIIVGINVYTIVSILVQ